MDEENEPGVNVYEALDEQPHDEPSSQDKNHALLFHDEAEKQRVTDEKDAEAQVYDEALKERVLATLKQVKAQMPAFQQYQQNDPELYQTFIGVVQSILQLAQRFQAPKDAPKEETEEKPEDDQD